MNFKYDIGIIGSFYVILSKYIDGVTLCEFIKNCNDIDNIKYLVKEILNGLNFIHDNNIQHSDIKPSNIIVTNNNKPVIIDFDFSVIIKNEFLIRNIIVGTKPYIPREIIMEKKYFLKSDIWELGATIVKLLTEKESEGGIKYDNNIYFGDQSNTSSMCFLSYVDIDLSFMIPKYGNYFCDIIKSMLTVDVNYRPSSGTLVERLKNN